MAQISSDNIQNNSPKALDNKWGKWVNGKWQPYESVADFENNQQIAGQYDTQLFFVRDLVNPTKAILYILGSDKVSRKLLDDVDFSDYYTKSEINNLLTPINAAITSLQQGLLAEINLRMQGDEELSQQIIDLTEQVNSVSATLAILYNDLYAEIDIRQDQFETLSLEIANKADLSSMAELKILTLTDLAPDAKTYSDSRLAGKIVNHDYAVYSTSINRYYEPSEITNIPAGGFVLTYTIDSSTRLFVIGTIYAFAGNNIQSWSANPFIVNNQVSWLGRLWYANQDTLAADIPGTSNKWSELLYNYSPSYAPKKNLFNKNDLVDGILNTSGQVSGTVGKTTNKFRVPGNTDIYIHGFSAGTLTGEHRWAVYNQAGTLLTIGSIIITGAKITKVTTPLNAYSMAVTPYRSEDSAPLYDFLQIERSFVTAYEPFQLNAVKIGDYPIRNADMDQMSKSEIIASIPTVSMSSVYTSKNMANPALFIAGQYYNVGDGYTVQLDARYFTGGFIPGEEGIAYSGGGSRGMRFVYFYRADFSWISSLNGERYSFVWPSGVGAAYCRFTGYMEDFNKFQFEVGAGPSSYVPYSGQSDFVSKINSKPIIATSLKAGATIDGKRIVNEDDLAAFGALAPFGNNVTILKDSNFYYIRSYFNETYDIVQKIVYEEVNNTSFDYQTEQLILKSAPDTISGYAGILLHSNGDDTAPIRTANEGHIGEGHGFQQPVAIATTNKTAEDLLSLWRDKVNPTNEFYLVELNGNVLGWYSKTKLVAGHWTTEKDFSSQTAIMEHVSGAVHTEDIVLTSYTIEQRYPVTQNMTKKVFLDGKEIFDDGLYKGKEAKFVCNYDIIDCCFITLQTPFKWNAGPSAMRFSIGYVYQLNGACVTHHEINFKRDKPIQYWYVNQATPISAPMWPRRFGYMPKTLPIGGVDYNAIAETTTALPEALFTPQYFIDPNLPPDRHIQFHAQANGERVIGFAMGFNTSYGVAKNSLRKDLVNAWALSPKSYPRVIYNYPALDQVIHVIGYRIWFDAKIGSAACVYGYRVNDVNYLFIDYKTPVVKDTIKVDPSFTNKSISIIEQSGDITLLSTELVPSTGLLISSNGGSLLLTIK